MSLENRNEMGSLKKENILVDHEDIKALGLKTLRNVPSRLNQNGVVKKEKHIGGP